MANHWISKLSPNIKLKALVIKIDFEGRTLIQNASVLTIVVIYRGWNPQMGPSFSNCFFLRGSIQHQIGQIPKFLRKNKNGVRLVVEGGY